MKEFISLCVIIIVVCVVIIFYQIKYNSIETFASSILENKNKNKNKLLVKKTLNYNKIFYNNSYTVWEPVPINDYYPLGHYVTFDNNKPKKMATLVKNSLGLKSKDKPSRYDTLSITNKEFAIWKPVPNDTFVSLGVIYAKDYPSKYIIRCVPKHFCTKSYIEKKLINNKATSNDKGYEIWSINNSEMIAINNLNNNKNISNLKTVYRLNHNYLDIEKKLYIRNTNKYTKICSYKNNSFNSEFHIWRPVPQSGFCCLGDIIISNSSDPNNTINTLVAHKSLCKIPLNYGNKPIYKINKSGRDISFWRPVPHNNYYFMGDIIVLGDNEPDSDDIVYSISIDYLKILGYDTHKIVYSNIDNTRQFSIWCDDNKFFSLSKDYNNVEKNGITLNKLFTYSNYDMLDLSRKIILKFKLNPKKNIDDNKLLDLIRDNLASKLDINTTRLENINFNKDRKEIELNLKARGVGTEEISINDIIKKIKHILDNEDIKIYNKNKDSYYMSIDELFSEENKRNIILDNTSFKNKLKQKKKTLNKY